MQDGCAPVLTRWWMAPRLLVDVFVQLLALPQNRSLYKAVLGQTSLELFLCLSVMLL